MNFVITFKLQNNLVEADIQLTVTMKQTYDD